jgi:flap endonuclease-1
MYLTDSDGNSTSHIKNIISLLAKFVVAGCRTIWVFENAVPPALKLIELERRTQARKESAARLEEKKASLDDATYQKRKQAISGIPSYCMDDIRKVLSYLSVPHFDSPPNIDGEHFAAHLTRVGLADMVLSDDYDTFLFGSQSVLRHIKTSTGSNDPNAFCQHDLVDVLQHLGGIELADLAKIGVVLGTDYAPGVYRVGPVTVLKKYRTLALTEVQQQAYDHITREFSPDDLQGIQIEWSEQPAKEDIDELSMWLRAKGFGDSFIKNYIDAIYR